MDLGKKQTLGGASRTEDCADHYGDRLRLANDTKVRMAINNLNAPVGIVRLVVCSAMQASEDTGRADAVDLGNDEFFIACHTL